MSKLTPEQFEEVQQLLKSHTESLNALSSAQRKEVEEIFERRDQASSLSPSQKWDVATIVGKMVVGGVAILGIAGYFTILNAARNTAASIKSEEAASALMQKADFLALVAGNVGQVVPGTVAAFDLASGCPKGWTVYANAIGRTIIGVGQVGTNKRLFQETGGSEEHVLTIEELPPLTVRTKASVAVQNSAGDRYNAGGRDYFVTTAQERILESDKIGAGKSFNTLSPYIALYYCKKD